jgi:hypothetical protein
VGGNTQQPQKTLLIFPPLRDTNSETLNYKDGQPGKEVFSGFKTGKLHRLSNKSTSQPLRLLAKKKKESGSM